MAMKILSMYLSETEKNGKDGMVGKVGVTTSAGALYLA